MDEAYAETLERVMRYQARECGAFSDRARSRRRDALAVVGSRLEPKVSVGIADASGGDSALTALCCLACGFFWTLRFSPSLRPNFCPGCGLVIEGFEV
jgi:hypothetical protein